MAALSPIGDSASHSSVQTAATGLSDFSDSTNDPSTSLYSSLRDLAKSPIGALQAEASGGSDTDTSKPDTISRKENHVRSNSFKKPASFKAVSITKNFLAKAAVGATPNSRVPEKGMLPICLSCHCSLSTNSKSSLTRSNHSYYRSISQTTTRRKICSWCTWPKIWPHWNYQLRWWS
jgi:hypothetical protein